MYTLSRLELRPCKCIHFYKSIVPAKVLDWVTVAIFYEIVSCFLAFFYLFMLSVLFCSFPLLWEYQGFLSFCCAVSGKRTRCVPSRASLGQRAELCGQSVRDLLFFHHTELQAESQGESLGPVFVLTGSEDC